MANSLMRNSAKVKSHCVILCNLALVLVSAIVAGCSRDPRTVAVEFQLRQPAGEIADVSFYVSDLRLLDAEGAAYPVQILHRGAVKHGQAASIHLIYLSHLQTAATVEGRAQLPDAVSGLAFTLGVPASLNHANPVTAAYPLNDSGMFWSWQQGYKFLRIDASRPANNSQWAFHLGSTGCQSPSALRPPPQPCQRSYQARITLNGFNPLQQPVIVDIGVISAKIDDNTRLNCTMNYGLDASCRAMVETLGLAVDTGACRNDCRAQRLFRPGSQQ